MARGAQALYPRAATGLMEKIVSRGNMMAAHSRVVSNMGAPGMDGMPVNTASYPIQNSVDLESTGG